MASAWSRGEHISAVEILARHPGLGDEAAIRLIFEEVCLRREIGQEVATTEVVNRFPLWKDELEVLLGCDRMLRPLSRVARFPNAGEALGPFRLLAELGRGASGKTFLAAEPALSDRLVVLKVITDDQEEHLSLARLRHTHIIPLFSEQTFPERGLRALCMPYLGGGSLARILEETSKVPLAERRGRHLLEALDRVQEGPGATLPGNGPYRRYLEQASYVQAICWIAACLADALKSTHQHEIIHMDVKPSNVLITADGLPLLLDFHLAHAPLRPGELISDRLGGTPGWMAPEHRAALEVAGKGQAVALAVDHRADLYALGLLLREALAGPGAVAEATAGRPWRQSNPEVSVGLADIVDKCLAARPSLRYADAGLLALDLRRQLNDLPLVGVPNRSLAERWRKWRRRRPAALARWTAAFTVCGALVVVLAMANAYYRTRVQEIEATLEDGRRLRESGQPAEAARTLGRGLKRARAVTATGALYDALKEQLSLARRGQMAGVLHDLAELIRFRYGIDLPAPEEASALLRDISAVWKQSDLLVWPPKTALDPATEQAIRTDLIDLAVTWAEIRVGLELPGDAETARAEACSFLNMAAKACGTSQRLDRMRRSLAGEKPADSGDVESLALSSLDHYDLGRSQLRVGRLREAAREFQLVLEQRPGDFWSNFYQGLCSYRLGQSSDAFAAFRTCVALAPGSAECYYNRARVAESLGRINEAVRDYDRAVELDPKLSQAFLNRGILALKVGCHEDAIADFVQATRTTSDPRVLGLIHFNLALAYQARGDHKKALESAQQALDGGCDLARALRDGLVHQSSE